MDKKKHFFHEFKIGHKVFVIVYSSHFYFFSFLYNFKLYLMKLGKLKELKSSFTVAINSDIRASSINCIAVIN